MKRFGLTLTILAASFGASACTDSLDNGEDGPSDPGTTGSENNTFDHDNDGFDPFKVIDRLAKEGPPKFRSRAHGCVKMPIDTLRAVMTSVGIGVGATTANPNATTLFNQGAAALGASNFANRIRESTSITASSASRQFDIWGAGAQEIIDQVPNLARCKVGGVSAQLFDTTTNACRADGITCITGVPAQAAMIDFCNIAVRTASTPDVGKRIAVAAIMAASFTCD